MKILYVAMKYDYGIPERGFSTEHSHFYNTLLKMDGGKHKIIYFPYDEIMRGVGRNKMNEKLLGEVKKEKPDLCFFVLFTDEIKKKTIRQITESGETITYNWFTDDHWRFRNYSKYWAPLFNWVSTTDSEAPTKYKKIGYHNVIRTQWASNPDVYKKIGDEFKYDVTFIGQTHGDREKVVKKIEDAGISVNCWGSGWSNGRIDTEDMVRVFSESKINLNFSQSSGTVNLKNIGKIFLNRRADSSYQLTSPLIWYHNLISLFIDKKRRQIKARPFEITGSGGFCITGFADDTDNYFVDGKEIVIFNNEDELIDKIKFYLKNDDKREKIAFAGYKRSNREHTYEERFREIFTTMGLPL